MFSQTYSLTLFSKQCCISYKERLAARADQETSLFTASKKTRKSQQKHTCKPRPAHKFKQIVDLLILISFST